MVTHAASIEMQMIAVRAYQDRVLYSWAKIFGDQLAEGEPYWNLRSTISISFVNDVLFPDVPDYHLDFQLRSSAHPGLTFTNRQQVHVIELPKFRKSADELTDPLDAWCYFLKNAATLDSDHLPQGMQFPPVRSAMERY